MAEIRESDIRKSVLESESDIDTVCKPNSHHRKNEKAQLNTLDTIPPCNRNYAKVEDVCTERCRNHKDKVVRFFCLDHNELGCCVCVTTEHKSCKDVASIQEIAKDLESSEDYKAFQTRLKRLTDRYEKIIESVTDRLDALACHYTKVLKDIETFKHDIVAQLCKLENKIKSRLNDVKRSNKERMNTVYDISFIARENLQSIFTEIQKLSINNQHCQMFTNVKISEKKLSKLEGQLKELENSRVSDFTFLAGEELQAVVHKQHALGSIVERIPEKMRLAHMIDVKVTSGRNTLLDIYGASVLSEKKLVITDYRDDTVKLYDTVNNKLVSEIKLVSLPWDVASVNQDLVAVTLPHRQKVMILKCGAKIVIEREIKVNGRCCGIDCARDRLFVIYHTYTKVEIMSMKGEVLQRFVTNNKGAQLFRDPTYVCVSADNQSIYVSDWSEHSVTQLDMEGDVVAVYKDAELKWPGKMVVDRAGMIYLCGERSHNIHLLTPQCRKVKILLGEKDGLRRPRSICYLEAVDRLLIVMANQDIMKVYKVK